MNIADLGNVAHAIKTLEVAGAEVLALQNHFFNKELEDFVSVEITKEFNFTFEGQTYTVTTDVDNSITGVVEFPDIFENEFIKEDFENLVTSFIEDYYQD